MVVGAIFRSTAALRGRPLPNGMIGELRLPDVEKILETAA